MSNIFPITIEPDPRQGFQLRYADGRVIHRGYKSHEAAQAVVYKLQSHAGLDPLLTAVIAQYNAESCAHQARRFIEVAPGHAVWQQERAAEYYRRARVALGVE